MLTVQQQDGDATKAEEPSTIERQELRRTKARRLAAVKGHYLLSQVVRYSEDLGC